MFIIAAASSRIGTFASYGFSFLWKSTVASQQFRALLGATTLTVTDVPKPGWRRAGWASVVGVRGGVGVTDAFSNL